MNPRRLHARAPLAAARRLRLSRPRRLAQRGSMTVEFALIFPVFFTVLYAIVSFSLIMMAQQIMTLAAEEGARAALNWTSNTSLQSALTNRGNNACTTANQLTAALAKLAGTAITCTPTSAPCGAGNAMQCINVALTYNYASMPLVPALPIMQNLLPSTLSSLATVQLNPENIQ